MLSVFGDHPLKQRPRLSRLALAQQALTQMRSRVEVLRIALESCSVTCLRLLKPPSLKINVAKLRMMMRFIEVMNLGLKLLNPPAVVGTRQFEAARRRRGRAIDREVIK